MVKLMFIGLFYVSEQWGSGSTTTISATFYYPVAFNKTQFVGIISDVGSGCHVMAITPMLNTYNVYQLQNIATSYWYIVLGV